MHQPKPAHRKTHSPDCCDTSFRHYPRMRKQSLHFYLSKNTLSDKIGIYLCRNVIIPYKNAVINRFYKYVISAIKKGAPTEAGAPKNAQLRLLRHNYPTYCKYAKLEYAFLPDEKYILTAIAGYLTVSQSHYTIKKRSYQYFSEKLCVTGKTEIVCGGGRWMRLMYLHNSCKKLLIVHKDSLIPHQQSLRDWSLINSGRWSPFPHWGRHNNPSTAVAVPLPLSLRD